MSTTPEIIIFRLISSAGFNRVEVSKNGTLLDLKNAISTVVQVHYKDQRLYTDPKYKKPITQSDSTAITKLPLSQGDAIFLNNQNAEFKSESSISTTKKEEDEKAKKKCNHSEREHCINCMDKIKANPDNDKKTEELKIREKAGLTSRCTHNIGQKCLYCIVIPENIGTAKELKYKCQHGANSKCPNCVENDFIEDRKHRSFDDFINMTKTKCKGQHLPTDKCNNCTPPLQVSHKMIKNCNNHAPYPQGSCTKCIPTGIILNRQPYRHVDYVSFMNQEELRMFIDSWQKGFCMKQRMAYLFGYFSKDFNYPDGIRAVVEAIYEPPQIGDETSVEHMEDKHAGLVDKVAKGLTLECVGWIFTTISTDDNVYMTSYDMRKVARYQEQFKVSHPSGCHVSKFVTCFIRPKGQDGNIEIQSCMVSDLYQALERDNILGECNDRKVISKRKIEKNELMPDIYTESKKVDNIPTEFGIVQVSSIFLIYLYCILCI